MSDNPTRRLERLEEERNTLMNSFGHGPFRDGLCRDRIAQIDAEIRALAKEATRAER